MYYRESILQARESKKVSILIGFHMYDMVEVHVLYTMILKDACNIRSCILCTYVLHCTHGDIKIF